MALHVSSTCELYSSIYLFKREKERLYLKEKREEYGYKVGPNLRVCEACRYNTIIIVCQNCDTCIKWFNIIHIGIKLSA
jgi:hypothetical protein